MHKEKGLSQAAGRTFNSAGMISDERLKDKENIDRAKVESMDRSQAALSQEHPIAAWILVARGSDTRPSAVGAVIGPTVGTLARAGAGTAGTVQKHLPTVTHNVGKAMTTIALEAEKVQDWQVF